MLAEVWRYGNQEVTKKEQQINLALVDIYPLILLLPIFKIQYNEI